MVGTRWLGALALLAGCGFRVGVGGVDANDRDDADSGDDDGSIVVDMAPPSCDAPLPWSAGIAPAATLYVDPSAVMNGNGSQGSPFTTITAAVAIAAPGTRILLAPGSYQPVTITDLRGTATAPIWIEGPATMPRASFTGTSGIKLNRPQYVVLQHLAFASITNDAINIDEGTMPNSGTAHHVVLDDVSFASVGTAIQMKGVTDVSISRSTVSSAMRGVFLVGVQRAVLSRLTLSTVTGAPVQFAAGSRDVVLRQSKIEGAGARAVHVGANSMELDFRPALAATDNYEARDIQIINNFIDGHEAAIVCGSCTDTLIANNRITGDLTHVIRVINEHPSGISGHEFPDPGTLRVIANAIEVTTNPFGTRMESNTSCATCVYANNQWLEIDNPQDSTPPLPVPETNGVYGVPSGYDAQGRLCMGGAAIGTGMTLTEVNGTYAGQCRALPPSIGPGNPDPGC